MAEGAPIGRRSRAPRALPGSAAAAAWLALSCGALALAPRAAHADGAFPDAQVILTPPTRPQEIVLVTNFGLIFSNDDGKTWLWACEQDANAYGIYYQEGATAAHRLFAVANDRAMFSDDQSCGWAQGAGMLAEQSVSDVWADRAAADRVLAVGAGPASGGAAGNVQSVFASSDGGATFTSRLFQAEPGAIITGIETSRSQPSTLYTTLIGVAPSGGKPPPELARSTDDGKTWTTVNLTGWLGDASVNLVAVDKDEPAKVFLLWKDVDGQGLAVTTDAGATGKRTLSPDGVLTSFLQMDDGTILIGFAMGTTAGLVRSTDGGQTFATVDKPPHIRALSQRGGKVYAATDNFSEGYAIGVSTDAGTTWTPLMAFSEVAAIVPCLKVACQDLCDVQANQRYLWDPAVCSADPPPPTGTGGAGGGGTGTGGAASGGTTGAAGTGGAASGGGGGNAGAGTGKSGCGCELSPRTRHDRAPWLALAGLTLAAVLISRRRRS